MRKNVKNLLSLVIFFLLVSSMLFFTLANSILENETVAENETIVKENLVAEINDTELVEIKESDSLSNDENKLEIENEEKLENENEEKLENEIFIENTKYGQSINDYEKEIIEKINEKFDIENEDRSKDLIEQEYNVYKSIDDNTNLYGAGNHTSTASPSVIIHSTYDRYEIYTGENEGTVRIFDDNGNYYDGETNVKVIRDMADSNNNSPILLNLANNVEFFDFDNSNDNYVLLPEGFVEDIVARYSGNGYLNPQGINKLDHIEVNVKFNNTNLGRYELFEYGVLYYLSCYEGVLGEYYYYDPNTTDIERATSFYINNRIMDRTYNIVSEYYYKSPSGEQLSFKPTWIVNHDNLIGTNKETYVKQWVNFPYFLIKTGEKYWNIRDIIEQSTYLTEYSEGYYEQYLTESPYGNISERLVVLDEIYKTEEDLLADNINIVAVHPYVKSDSIKITGNYREDKVNAENKLKAGGMLPYNTYAVLNVKTTERRAKSVQVYLNGEKLITNNNKGLYVLDDSKCQIRIDGSKLFDEENSRNVVSIILLDEAGNYITDEKGRIVNNYISLIRSSKVNKEKYKVSFNTNGWTTLPNINVEEGNKLSLPTNPSRNNYIFQGWYNDSNFENKFDIDEYIIGNKTLYALWGLSIPKPVTKEENSKGNERRSSGGSGGGGSGGGSSGGGAGIPNGTTTSNMLNQMTPVVNTNKKVNAPNTRNSVAVRGNWSIVGNKWQFSDTNGEDYRDEWVYIDVSSNPMKQNADWYRFDENGNMQTGFYVTEGRLYYFDDGVINKSNEGKMLVGWHWLPSIDGGYACYYFDTSEDSKGELVRNTITRDGYIVDIYGRWCDNGEVQNRSYR